MRVFGLLSLLVVLAVVGLLASRQMKTTAIALQADAPASATVQERSQQTQQQVRDDVNRAVQQSTDRLQEADK